MRSYVYVVEKSTSHEGNDAVWAGTSRTTALRIARGIDSGCDDVILTKWLDGDVLEIWNRLASENAGWHRHQVRKPGGDWKDAP